MKNNVLVIVVIALMVVSVNQQLEMKALEERTYNMKVDMAMMMNGIESIGKREKALTESFELKTVMLNHMYDIYNQGDVLKNINKQIEDYIKWGGMAQ